MNYFYFFTLTFILTKIARNVFGLFVLNCNLLDYCCLLLIDSETLKENMDYEDANVIDDDYNDSSETQISTWRTLIELVKANPVLYKKNLKGYSKSDKNLIWANIGDLLTPPMTGKWNK